MPNPDDLAAAAPAALAFIDEPGEGQTEQYDDLRLHLLSAHCNLAALGHTDVEALAEHEHEHRGPCTIRNHDQDATFWDHSKILGMLIEQDRDDFLVEEAKNELGRQVAAHQHRVSRRRLAANPVPMYERVSRYTISVLPDDHPRRRYYEIRVNQRPDGSWVVLHDPYWTDAAGNWAVPFSGDHVGRYLFNLDDALALARAVAPYVECNGRTAFQVATETKENQG